MARRTPPKTVLNMESLESRQVLSAGVAPTGEAQYMLELVNAVRSRPRAAAEILASRVSTSTRNTLSFYGVDLNNATRAIAESKPVQPLAWNDSLASAATSHSRDMATRGFQSHQGSDGAWGDERIDRAGYGRRTRTAENAYAYSDSVDQAIQAFAYDWGVADRGHFRNLSDSAAPDGQTFKEVGFGIVDSNLQGFGKVVTQDFGLRSDSPSYLLGVAFDDTDGDPTSTPMARAAAASKLMPPTPKATPNERLRPTRGAIRWPSPPVIIGSPPVSMAVRSAAKTSTSAPRT